MRDDQHTRADAAKRLAELRQEGAQPTAEQADEGNVFESEQDSLTFSMVSADRQRKVMVQFRMKDGNAKARAYAYLVGIDFNPSKGIAMDFSTDTVKITGRNLRPLFDGLVTQRVAVVPEIDDLQAEANLPADATVVLKIEIKPVE